MQQFTTIQDIAYVDKITHDSIYSYLNHGDIVQQTRLTRYKTISAVLNRFFNNGWLQTRFWKLISVKVDKRIKPASKKKDIEKN